MAAKHNNPNEHNEPELTNGRRMMGMMVKMMVMLRMMETPMRMMMIGWMLSWWQKDGWMFGQKRRSPAVLQFELPLLHPILLPRRLFIRIWRENRQKLWLCITCEHTLDKLGRWTTCWEIPWIIELTFSHEIWKCYIWIVGILLPKGFQLWRAHRVQLRLIRIKICPKLGEEKTFARVETVTGFNQVGGQNSSHLLPKHLIETR